MNLKDYIMFTYSQTWVNDHIRIMTTCLQRPLFWDPNLNFHNIMLPLNKWPPVNNGHKFWVPMVVVIHRFDCILAQIRLEWHTYSKRSAPKCPMLKQLIVTQSKRWIYSKLDPNYKNILTTHLFNNTFNTNSWYYQHINISDFSMLDWFKFMNNNE